MHDISILSEIGGREYNQDCVMVSQKNGKYCIAVADGLGSYNGSEIASRVAVQYLIDWFNENCDSDELFVKSSVSSALMRAHNKILERKESDMSISSSCTTIALVVSDNVTSVMAHIGDTRIYEIKNGKILYRSKDHSLAQIAVERGEITTDEIRTHKDQNKLLRVLGSDYFVDADISTDFFPLTYGDGFVICTDGLWEYVSEKEFEELFENKSTSCVKLNKLKSLHDERADEYCDNFSVAVFVKGE
jgi:serine/threonine protein phosphatase PrpC